MQVYKLTKDKIEIGNSYVVLTTLLMIELDAFDKVTEVRTVFTTNEEISIDEASERIKELPNRSSKILERNEFDELVELYKNNIKDFQSYL